MTTRASARRAALAAALALGALALAACSASTSPSASSSTSPSAPATSAQPTPSVGTAFDQPIDPAVAALPLTDQSGAAVSLDSLKGKTVVLADFLTLCQEICPLTSANLATLQTTLDTAGLTSDVVLLEATVDPARDTVARLAAYQKLFGAKPNWLFATGTPEQIAALWKAFGVDYEKKPGEAPFPKDWWNGKPVTYDVEHQDVVIVIDPQGHERWVVQGSPNTEGVKPPATLDRFLNDDGQKNLTTPEDPNWTAAQVASAVAWVTGKPVG